MTNAAPVAMAMVGKPRTAGWRCVGRLKLAAGARAMLAPATATKTSGGATHDGQQVAAADEERGERRVDADQADEGDQAQAHAHEERVDGARRPG